MILESRHQDVIQFSQKIFILVLVIGLMIFPQSIFQASKDGLLLWFNVVLPSLLPFMICADLMNTLGITRWFERFFRPIMYPLFRLPGSTAFAWFIGMFSGYPVGAKVTVDLLQNGEITKKEAQNLLSFCNNSGPLFILSAVSVGIFKHTELGIPLLLIHYFSSFITGLIYCRFHPTQNSYMKNKHDTRVHAHHTYQKNILGNSIQRSLETIVQIGGFIIFFSVVMEFIEICNLEELMMVTLQPLSHFLHLSNEFFAHILIGAIEITNGIQLLCSLQIPISHQMVGISFLIAWSGLSIHAQTISVLGQCEIKVNSYIFCKFIQSCIAVLLTIGYIQLFFR